jgi:uncharacterized protein involved in exopolysaccharide biosynthesis
MSNVWLPNSRENHPPQPGVPVVSGESIDFFEILRLFWQQRVIIGAATLIVGVIGTAYAFLAEPWYRAEVVMIPTRQGFTQGIASQLSQLGGLASLAGLAIGSDNEAEPVAVLQSNQFLRDFLEDKKLLPILFHKKWNADKQAWNVASDDVPDYRDGVEYFNKSLRRVYVDRKTGIVRLIVEWRDARTAAEWANAMVDRVNVQMRARASSDAERNIAYLHKELASTDIVSLQQSAGRLLESEMQKLMLARGSEEFAFRVLDPAHPPKNKVRPRRLVLIGISLLLGAMVGCAVAIMRSWLGAREEHGPAAIKP